MRLRSPGFFTMEAYDMQPTIACWEVYARLGDDEVVVVDCRSDEEFELMPRTIPGALRMPLDEILETPYVLPDDELVVLYDTACGKEALRARVLLHRAGRRVSLLDGGLRAWLGAGFPTDGRLTPSRPAIDHAPADHAPAEG